MQNKREPNMKRTLIIVSIPNAAGYHTFPCNR